MRFSESAACGRRCIPVEGFTPVVEPSPWWSLSNESTAKRVCHRSGAAFAEENSLARHAHACFAMHPSWFVFRVLCALSVSAVRSRGEVVNTMKCLLSGRMTILLILKVYIIFIIIDTIFSFFYSLVTVV
jgi:hypothetical protein